MTKRALPTLVWTGGLVSASGLTLGKPDLTLASQFLSGSYPSLETAVAVISMLCYGVVAAVAVLAITQAVRAASDAQADRMRSSRAAMFLVVGATVLIISIAHRSLQPYVVCCGAHPQDIQEAATLAH